MIIKIWYKNELFAWTMNCCFQKWKLAGVQIIFSSSWSIEYIFIFLAYTTIFKYIFCSHRFLDIGRTNVLKLCIWSNKFNNFFNAIADHYAKNRALLYFFNSLIEFFSIKHQHFVTLLIIIECNWGTL
jgi:hypothetical protein